MGQGWEVVCGEGEQKGEGVGGMEGGLLGS